MPSGVWFALYWIAAIIFGFSATYIRYRWFADRSVMSRRGKDEELFNIILASAFWPICLIVAIIGLPFRKILRTEHQSIRDRKKEQAIKDREREFEAQQREIDAFCDANDIKHLPKFTVK